MLSLCVGNYSAVVICGKKGDGQFGMIFCPPWFWHGLIEVINDRCDFLRANLAMYDESLGKYQLQAQGFLSLYM